MFVGDQRKYEREAAGRGHSAPGGGFGVRFLSPTNEKGGKLDKKDLTDFEMQFGVECSILIQIGN